jgi:hypothetical protein
VIGAFIQLNTETRSSRSRPIGYLITEQGCWDWVGYTKPNGYPEWNRGPTKNRPAYRGVYEMLRGSIPPGLDLDHLCRNPRCVNPDHLEPVTRQVNNARRVLINQYHPRTSCCRGHPLSGPNVYWYRRPGASHPIRRCRICKNAAMRRLRALGRVK